MTENEMVGCYHQLNEHEIEQAPGDGEGQGSLACCSPWGCKELSMNQRLKINSKCGLCHDLSCLLVFFFFKLALNWPFHSPPSLSSRGSLVHLFFLLL